MYSEAVNEREPQPHVRADKCFGRGLSMHHGALRGFQRRRAPADSTLLSVSAWVQPAAVRVGGRRAPSTSLTLCSEQLQSVYWPVFFSFWKLKLVRRLSFRCFWAK